MIRWTETAVCESVQCFGLQDGIHYTEQQQLPISAYQLHRRKDNAFRQIKWPLYIHKIMGIGLHHYFPDGDTSITDTFDCEELSRSLAIIWLM